MRSSSHVSNELPEPRSAFVMSAMFGARALVLCLCKHAQRSLVSLSVWVTVCVCHKLETINTHVTQRTVVYTVERRRSNRIHNAPL